MTEKSRFLEMFEKLSPEEQEKVSQLAQQMGEMVVKKGVKNTGSEL